MASVSIVTVTHQSREFILAALASARTSAEATGLDYEVIVVDNASTDGSAELVQERCAWVRLIRNAENVGFGRANNQAFAVASGRVVVLLNPDATLDPPAVRQLVGFLDAHPQAAAVAPRLRGPGRSESGGMFPGIRSLVGHFLLLNRLLPGERGGALRGVLLRQRDSPTARPVEWVGGAAVALDARAVADVGGFDPTIFLYAEDVDLCARLRAAGRGIWVLPAATGSHLIAGSQGRLSTLWVQAVHDYYREQVGTERGARLRTAAFDLILAGGLAMRALPRRRAPSTEQRLHHERMRAGARRAAGLLYRSLAGGG